MMHDFALTEKYVVIFDLPITFDPAGAERGDIVPYVWNEKHPTRVGLLPRAGGEVRWFEVDPVYYSHTLNAYDEGSSVVVDMTTYPAPSMSPAAAPTGPTGRAPPRSSGGRSTWRTAAYAPGRSTTARRSSRVYARSWCPGGTGTPTRRPPPT